ncbi:MAG: tetratricopeptide repeat protein [Acidobacteriia bacterium]|nr:tetratricopeptide repeat protein [Terriglobia bacterium]
MKALPLLETLVRTDPKAADAHADLASVYAASGNREGAEKSFRRALELQPDYFPALAGLGNLLARAGDDSAALPLLRQAGKLQPSSTNWPEAGVVWATLRSASKPSPHSRRSQNRRRRARNVGVKRPHGWTRPENWCRRASWKRRPGSWNWRARQAPVMPRCSFAWRV